jgi:hypothetical protein
MRRRRTVAAAAAARAHLHLEGPDRVAVGGLDGGRLEDAPADLAPPF